MDHRDFLKTLSPAQRTVLNEKSDAIGLLHLIVHFGLIALFAALTIWQVTHWPNVVLSGLLMMTQGILLVFLFTLLHETSHFTPFASPWLNRFVGVLCGVILILPPMWFRYFHLAHHRFTQMPGKDPELASPHPKTFVQYALHISGIPTWRGHFKALFGNAIGKSVGEYIPTAKAIPIRNEARVMLLFYVLLAGAVWSAGAWQILYIWLIPLVLGQPFLRLYLMAEHGRCPMVSDMFANTRTTFTSWMLRKLAWNMPYHAEHHASPNVPFHKLPALHALARPHLLETEQGYGRFHWKTITQHLR